LSLLFYAASPQGAGQRLEQVLEAFLPAHETRVCRSMEDLLTRLRQPGNVDIAILLAASREELCGLVDIRELLQDVRIILVLPDREEATIAKAHRLWPRFLTDCDSDFDDVVAVLTKMLTIRGEGDVINSECRWVLWQDPTKTHNQNT